MAEKNGFRRFGWRAVMLAVALALLLPAGCGKKGDPELPKGETDQFPKQYPDPDSL